MCISKKYKISGMYGFLEFLELIYRMFLIKIRIQEECDAVWNEIIGQ